MNAPVVRYRTLVSDNARWRDFELRTGDIVISTPPKSGTTWTQMMCALLVFDGPEFPAPLELMTPWVDALNRTITDVCSAYAAQTHRRFLKTHTPLDGLPVRDDVTYVVVGRDPRDVVISMEHHATNMNYERFFELRRHVLGADGLDDLPRDPGVPEDPVERFRQFVNSDDLEGVLTLARVLHHLDTAWTRRSSPNVALFHYSDYQADLTGELRRLADALDIEVSEARAEELASEASLERMRERADEVVPSASLGNWKSNVAFLRAGTSGEWRDRVTKDELDDYDRRVASLVPPDLAAWAHGGRLGSGIDPLAR